jgi:hypothetical protein
MHTYSVRHPQLHRPPVISSAACYGAHFCLMIFQIAQILGTLPTRHTRACYA